MTDGDNRNYAGFESLMPTIDEFGVPSNIFGRQPEEFFQMLGRIVALASSVEYTFRVFYEHVAPLEAQDKVPGSFAQLVKESRRLLPRLLSAADRQFAQSYISDAEKAVSRRHEYVHSLWPAQGSGRLFRWKPGRLRNSVSQSEELTLKQMRRDIAALVAVCEVQRRNRFISLPAANYASNAAGPAG